VHTEAARRYCTARVALPRSAEGGIFLPLRGDRCHLAGDAGGQRPAARAPDTNLGIALQSLCIHDTDLRSVERAVYIELPWPLTWSG
jgi:hypothetical protein